MLIFIALIFCSFSVFFLFMMLYFKNQKQKMQQDFKSISFDLMNQNSKMFLDQTKQVLDNYQELLKGDMKYKQKEIESIINPVKETLNKIDQYSKEIESKRAGAYESIKKQLQEMVASENNLRKETENLTKALKSPNIRGSWGQIHLRRVVELAGMLNNCDFFEQTQITKEDRIYRPDLIVKLPGDRQIVVDAKTPLDAYLEAIEASDQIKEQRLKSHALQLKKHIKDLSTKEYWNQFEKTPEFVILFLPAEAFFSSAVAIDPSLIEHGAQKNIIIATPTTLIAILKSIAYGWKQQQISKNAEEIAKTGKELYERLMIMKNHFSKLGKSLSTSIDSYNQTISSMESRVLVSARKLQQMGLANKDEIDLEEINKTTRSIIVE